MQILSHCYDDAAIYFQVNIVVTNDMKRKYNVKMMFDDYKYDYYLLLLQSVTEQNM